MRRCLAHEPKTRHHRPRVYPTWYNSSPLFRATHKSGLALGTHLEDEFASLNISNTSCCRSRNSLRWVTDAWFLIQRHPDLDWELFVESAVQSRIALPIYIILGYLADVMGATIPDKVLDRLRSAAHDTGATGRAAALVGAQSCANGTFENIMRRMNSWHERVQILKWMLFPPPVYFRWLYGVRHAWQLPFYYVLRPLGYVVRRIGRLVKLAPNNRDDQAELTFRG